MCIGCPDFVDYCNEGKCDLTPSGGRYKHTNFYLDTTFCEHLTQKHGTEKANLYDHVRREHWWELEDIPSPNPHPTDCKDHCIEKGWYTLEEVERVIDKLRENE